MDNLSRRLRRSALCGALSAILAFLLPSDGRAAIPQSERDVLAVLYQTTAGASWTRSDGWLGAGGTECTWYGVICDDTGSFVTALELQENNLRGEMPASIAGLTHLKLLNLSGNALTGSVPASIGSLPELEGLELSNNALTGSLPASIGLLSRLTYLSMNENGLRGPLPSTIAQLSNLSELYLAGNQFSGPLPEEFFQLPGLERVSFERNALTGGISEFARFTNLIELNLNLNEFSGAIPRELSQLTHLQSLTLSGNRFTGAIPAELATLAELETLDLSFNSLQGEIPPQLGALLALKNLTLSGDQLTGTIPAQLTNLRALVFLDLSGNALTGSIPKGIGQLVQLENLYLFANQLSGPIPVELGELRSLQQLLLNQNRLTGVVPATIGNLTSLQQFSVGDNDLDPSPFPIALTNLASLQSLDLSLNRFEGTIPPEIGRLTQLEYLVVNDNHFSGSVPPQLFQLPRLLQLRLDRNALTGAIPTNFSALGKIELLDLYGNQLEGEIPAELGSVHSLLYLLLGGNRLRGTIPSELGQLSNLLVLGVEENRLVGPVPSSITNLTSLTEGESGFGFNLLFTTDPAVRSFLNQKQGEHDFELTQTVPPTEFSVTAVRARAAILSWQPIRYVFDEGGYQISASRTANGEPVAVVTTASKDISSVVMDGLEPLTQYFFTIRTVTYPHEGQQSELISDAVAPISASTPADVPIPALVVVTARPTGMIQREDVIEKDDFLLLTNFGDLSTEVTLTRTGNFFELDPISFDIEPGDTVFVGIRPLPQAPGVYEGSISIATTAGNLGLSLPVTLLSAGGAAGNVIAVPSSTRVDVFNGLRGSVTYNNIGTAPLMGVTATDSPWIKPDVNSVSIPPQGSATVEFTIDPALRPDGNAPSGSVNGNLSLLYLSGAGGAAGTLAQAKREFSSLPPGVSATASQVVHTVPPSSAPGSIPALGAGEVARFVPGVAHLSRLGSSLLSDVLITNAFGSGPLSGIRLFFTPAGNASPTMAAVPTISPSAFVQLADVVRTVYGNSDGSGSLILRTPDWSSILVSANLLASRNLAGETATQLPVFRSDRSAAPGESFALAGVADGAFDRTDLFVQETSGQPATVTIEFFDAQGAPAGTPRPADSIASYGLLQLIDAVPAGAVSATVSNLGVSSGRVAVYALATDSRTGDGAVVTEWSRYFGYDRNAIARIPLITSSSSSSPARRRPVRPGVTAATIGEASVTVTEATDVTIFNPDLLEAEGTIRYVESGGRTFEQAFRLPSHASLLMRDVASKLIGSSRASTGQLLVEVTRGRAATSGRRYRTFADGTRGSEVPAVEAFSGLRVGQSRLFAGVEDASPASVLARTPGSVRSDLVFAENEGESVTVRVRLLYSTGRSAYATLQSREFRVEPFEVLTVPGLSGAVIGSTRDRLGDLHDIQVQIEVVSGNGAVTVMLVATENGSGDSILRLE